jgi:hypothetical protein
MSDVPILGRRNVAAAFGVTSSTLKRWLNDAEIEQRYKLRDFTFRVGVRWATTERLRARFLEHMQSIDPREVVRHEVAATATKETRMKASTKAGIDRYAATGCPVGGFLTAVLSNDLKNAVMRADDENSADLFEIVRYCYWEITSPCWGSPEIVRAWIQKHADVREAEVKAAHEAVTA